LMGKRMQQFVRRLLADDGDGLLSLIVDD
jgi:hypothetical protein